MYWYISMSTHSLFSVLYFLHVSFNIKNSREILVNCCWSSCHTTKGSSKVFRTTITTASIQIAVENRAIWCLKGTELGSVENWKCTTSMFPLTLVCLWELGLWCSDEISDSPFIVKMLCNVHSHSVSGYPDIKYIRKTK